MTAVHHAESRVNVYGSALGKVLASASNAVLTDVDGNDYLDLFSSAGVANFGHNHPQLKRQLIDYLERDGLVHGLDYHSASKLRFIERMEALILPAHVRGRYRYYFSPPTGTLAMEAAIKYARKATGRRELACFTNGFHGLTYNALAITGNVAKRRSAYCDLPNVTRLPYEGYLGPDADHLAHYRRLLQDPSGGCELPAALVFETIQAEGGCHACSPGWYQGVMQMCRELGIVTILDDIQAGVGRTGEYFSFPALGDAWPDIVCLSKSISGLGLPLSLVLVRADLDVLDAGENSGTFRGNCLAVESAGNALELFAQAPFQAGIRANLEVLDAFCAAVRQDGRVQVRGRGMLRGLAMGSKAAASQLIARCRDRRILLESCGGAPDTVKVMPPLTCDPGQLAQALETVLALSREVLDDRRPPC